MAGSSRTSAGSFHFVQTGSFYFAVTWFVRVVQELRMATPLTLGYLVDRYRLKAAAEKAEPENGVFVRTDCRLISSVGFRREASTQEGRAAAEGCDFPGLGPHSFRRANNHSGGRWVEHRRAENRRPQHGSDDRGIGEPAVVQ